MTQRRNRTQRLTLARAIELRRRGRLEDPRDLAREFHITVAHVYAVIRGAAHHPRVTVALDDETLAQLETIARQRHVTIEELCAETLCRAAVGP